MKSKTIDSIYDSKNNSFTLLGIVMSILIIFFHSYPLFYGTNTTNVDFISKLFNGENLGSIIVAMFFIISGFMIDSSIKKSKKLSVYVKKRIIKIFPPLIFCLLITIFIIVPLVIDMPFISYVKSPGLYKYYFLNNIMLWKNTVYAISNSFLSNPYPSAINGSLWTMKHQIMMYVLIVPVFYGIIKKNKKMLIPFIIGLFSLNVLSYLGLLNDFYEICKIKFGYFGIVMELSMFIKLLYYFFIGVVLSEFKDKIPVNKYMILFMISLLLISNYFGYFAYTAMIIIPYFTIVIGCIKSKTKFIDISYEIYIFAFPIQQLITYYFGNNYSVYLYFVFSSILTIAIAIISYYICEKPFKTRRVVDERIILENEKIKFDIVFATYNSSKWIDKCMDSILSSDYDLKNVSLLFCDNNSSDDTIDKLNKVKHKHSNRFNKILITTSKKNIGFGRANNKAFKLGDSDFVFFLNIDTEIEKTTLSDIESEIKKSFYNHEKIGIWELRQKPYEHPKYYDPITHYVSWASGACFIMKRSLFKSINGFDKHIFMYCEDVDLSWNVRKIGYNIKYLYNVPIMHYSYSKANEFKVTQFINSITNNLYLKFKYGKIRNVFGFYKGFIKLYFTLYKNENLKKYDLKRIKKQINHSRRKMAFFGVIEYLKRIKNTFDDSHFKPKFIGYDYEMTKDGAFNIIDDITANPLVSIIVRTCGRPDVLRENLISLRQQTYKNIEIIVVEDGKNISQAMINKEFSDLNIKYQATIKKCGRCKTGNIALSIATGKYFNFLDDDDVFYEDHVATLVSYLENNHKDVAFTTAFETAIDIKSKIPYKYDVTKTIIRYSFDFNYPRLMIGNCFPIQSVMFRKKLYDKLGGFDETMDALEDWDFWIRYALNTPFSFIKRTTSIYRVPAHPESVEKRQMFLYEPLKTVRNRYKDVILKVKSSDIQQFDEINEIEKSLHLQEMEKLNILKRIIRFAKNNIISKGR